MVGHRMLVAFILMSGVLRPLSCHLYTDDDHVGLAPADVDPTFQRIENFTALCSPCGFTFFCRGKILT